MLNDLEQLKRDLACCASGEEGCQECTMRYCEGFECTQNLAAMALAYIKYLEAHSAAKPEPKPSRLIDVDDAIAQVKRREHMMIGDNPRVSIGSVVKFLENRPVVKIDLTEGGAQ